MPRVLFDNIGFVDWKTDTVSIGSGLCIYKVSVRAYLHLLACKEKVLSRDEQIRAANYRQKEDNERFVVGRVALRQLLGSYLDIPANAVGLVAGKNGKPEVAQGGKAIHYNTAHSGDVVLIAICDRPVGIDIEYIDKHFDFHLLLSEYFSEAERNFISNSPEPRSAFYCLWTRKEALLKATGEGVIDDMLLVPCLDGMHIADEVIIASGVDWQIRSFEIGQGYMGSIACSTADMRASFFTGLLL